MNKLDTERINEYAPYKVEMEGGHPQLQTIINMFNKQIAMFRANKPQ